MRLIDADEVQERIKANESAYDAWSYRNANFLLDAAPTVDAPQPLTRDGVLAAVKAIEAVDECLGRVVATVLASGGACLITADHGNADHMLEPDGSPNTAHSLNPVPLILTIPGPDLAEGGILADVAPTVLEALGIEQPDEMTGTSLIQTDFAR